MVGMYPQLMTGYENSGIREPCGSCISVFFVCAGIELLTYNAHAYIHTYIHAHVLQMSNDAPKLTPRQSDGPKLTPRQSDGQKITPRQRTDDSWIKKKKEEE